MDNKKIVLFFVFLSIILSFCVIAVISRLPSIEFSIKEASVVAIIGGADGPTTIYISRSYYWKLILLYSLLIIIIDIIVLIIKKIFEYKNNKSIDLKHFVLFILIFDIIIILLLLPSVILHLLIVNTFILVIYLIIIFLRKSKK